MEVIVAVNVSPSGGQLGHEAESLDAGGLVGIGLVHGRYCTPTGLTHPAAKGRSFSLWPCHYMSWSQLERGKQLVCEVSSRDTSRR